jgi:hypothetical protein
MTFKALSLSLAVGVSVIGSGCSGRSLASHREKAWIQPGIAGGKWSPEEIKSLGAAVDAAAARHGLKWVPGIPPWHLFDLKRRITCNAHISFLGQDYILSAFYTQKESCGQILVEMDHDPGCPMLWETGKQRQDCTALWADVCQSLHAVFGERFTQQPSTESGVAGR